MGDTNGGHGSQVADWDTNGAATRMGENWAISRVFGIVSCLFVGEWQELFIFSSTKLTSSSSSSYFFCVFNLHSEKWGLLLELTACD